VTYQSPTTHRRTPAELADQALSWARPDRSFFAAGACHILAWTFVQTAAGRGFATRGLRRAGEPHPFHVVADDGAWAFDYAGWTERARLLAVIGDAVNAERPGTVVEVLDLDGDLETFCALHNHRRPDQFAGDVRARALAYLTTFTESPVRNGMPR
jgi:hypothetical protein